MIQSLEAKYAGVVLSVDKRWEDGTPHHPKSLELMMEIRALDRHTGDYFDWKMGGDGDNGESLMYLLDMIFERNDLEVDT